jgi:hypothetical protein
MVVTMQHAEQDPVGRELVARILARQSRQQQEALAWAAYERARGRA